ncbi:hypothetical protein [Lentzea aerocolonigenes]|nr:hypothetical protein [Lentzea aerocolonigenes]
MRSQFMAPAYALLISLAVALVLGSAMSPAEEKNSKQTAQPTEQATAGTVTVRLRLAKTTDPDNQDTEPATGEVVSSVTIQSGKPLKLDENGSVTGPVADGTFTVCAQLKGRWVGVDPTNEKPATPCWQVNRKTGPFNLFVKEG